MNEPAIGRLPDDLDDDRRVGTRKPLALWDRVKFVLLFAGAWCVLAWSYYAVEGDITLGEALRHTLRSGAWLLVLLGLEVLRQIHFLISERSAGYNYFWTHQVFGRLNGRIAKLNPWNRYRISRALKVVFVLVIADLVIAALNHTSAATALFELPAKFVAALPFVFQLLLYTFLLLFQFVMLFWFLSRGGSEVIYPEDVTTRFDDIKGQDAVLTRVKENVIFLERPDLIEEHGGTVPQGILLWGPPGTGKTMMAKAVAGETSKPFIFVEPGAFIQMFMGVGVIKVKALFRKARKLALRYGGVILFFDEVDALGNRGVAVSGGGWHPTADGSPWSTSPPCNGLSYVSSQSASLLLRDSLHTNLGPAGPVRNGVIAGLGGMSGGAGMGTLQALLGEMDGMDKPRGFWNRSVRRTLGMRPKPPPKYRILTIMATNIPDVLDEAMLRPGRIDRIYKVGYPSKQGRIDTFHRYLEGKDHHLTDEDIDKLGTITAYYGGAAIEDLVNAALINAITAGRTAIEWGDVVKAKQVKDLGLPDDVDYIERERHAVAVHEACHAVTAYRIRKRLLIDIVTIEKGGTFLGVVTEHPPGGAVHDVAFGLRSRRHGGAGLARRRTAVLRRRFLVRRIRRPERGHVADHLHGGVLGDGLDGRVPRRAPGPQSGRGPARCPGGGNRPDQDILEGGLGHRVESRLDELLRRTRDLLEGNRLEVLAVAHALETHKTVTGEDVGAIVDGRQGALIDGRPYRSPEAALQIEAYHVEAVAAHKARSKVALPLPVMAQFVPAQASGGNGGPSTEGRAWLEAHAWPGSDPRMRVRRIRPMRPHRGRTGRRRTGSPRSCYECTSRWPKANSAAVRNTSTYAR